MNKLLSVDIGQSFLNNSSANLSNASGVNRYVSALISGGISIAGIILLFILISGGLAIIRGAGKSDPKTVEQGKQAATSAIIGFIVVLSAYWIVKLIESITGLVLI